MDKCDEPNKESNFGFKSNPAPIVRSNQVPVFKSNSVPVKKSNSVPVNRTDPVPVGKSNAVPVAKTNPVQVVKSNSVPVNKSKSTVAKVKKEQLSIIKSNPVIAKVKKEVSPIIKSEPIVCKVQNGGSLSSAKCNEAVNDQSNLNAPEPPKQKSLSPLGKQLEMESDKVMEKLRNFQQDIRQRKLKHQQKLQELQWEKQKKPNAKAMDIEYYANNMPQIPKVAPVRIVQPNSPEVPTRNRIRLIRSYAKDEPDEIMMDSQIEHNQAKVIGREQHPRTGGGGGGGGMCADSIPRSQMPDIPKQTIAPDLLSMNGTAPMRSTYF